MVTTFLTKFGLTKNERDIYLYLLENGAAIASIIGKRLGIKRVTTYAALETLNKKSLVATFQKNNVSYFEAVTPDEIVNLCNRKVEQGLELKRQAEKAMSELKKLENKQSQHVFELKGKIKYYQGLDAVKQLINETLGEGKQEQLCFGLNKYHTDHLQDDWMDYTKRRVSIGMNVRSIQPDVNAAKEYKKRDKAELRITRLVSHEKFPASCELNIMGDTVAIFSAHGEEPTGMKICNREMAQVLRSLFEVAWEKSEEYDEVIEKKKK